MNTKINLTYKGIPYVLEYNRIAVKMLEANGFVLDEFLSKPMTNIELAFSGAFIKNHPSTPQTIVDEIFNGSKNKKKLIAVLQKMITETYDSLLDETSDEGNVTWEIMDLSPTVSQK